MRLTALIAVFALVGCNATYRQPELTTAHPANPQAPVVASVRQTGTLDLSAADPVAPPVSAASAGHEGHVAEPASAPRGQGHGEGRHDAPASEPAGTAIYECPVHSEVTSDKPGQRCPKCGMALVPREEGGRP